MNARLSRYAVFTALTVTPMLIMGCTSSQKTEIPASATMLNDAHGDITVTAPHNGMVYVYDKTDDKLIYSGKVNRDDVVRLDEKTGNIMINDRIAAGKSLDSDDEHQIYFKSSHPEEARQATYVAPDGDTTVITHDDNGTHETVVAPQ